MTIPDMVGAAGTIFIGSVVETRGVLDERGDPVTHTTFRVEQAIKGTSSATFSIKQYGGKTSTVTMLLNHMRYFRQGERVMVMLYPASRLGFSSPVGMDQGVWSVENNLVQRVTREALGGMASTLRRNGVAQRDVQSIPAATFVSIVRDAMSQGGAAR